jgi:hypothetical protein
MTRATRSSFRIRFNTDAGATSPAVAHLECGAGLAIADGGPGVHDRPLACTLAGSTRAQSSRARRPATLGNVREAVREWQHGIVCHMSNGPTVAPHRSATRAVP